MHGGRVFFVGIFFQVVNYYSSFCFLCGCLVGCRLMLMFLYFVLVPSGKMFQAPDLNLIVEFIFMFYKEKPIDWLLDHILWVKVCNPEKDAVCLNCSFITQRANSDSQIHPPLLFVFLFVKKHCERQKSSLRVRFRPSLFQHVGLHSSLAGKIQKLTVSPTPLGKPSIFGGGPSYFLRRPICLGSASCRTRTS